MKKCATRSCGFLRLESALLLTGSRIFPSKKSQNNFLFCGTSRPVVNGASSLNLKISRLKLMLHWPFIYIRVSVRHNKSRYYKLFKCRFSFFQGIPELVITVSFLLLRERQRPTNSSLSVRFVLFPPNILGSLFIFITTLLQSSSSQQVACW